MADAVGLRAGCRVRPSEADYVSTVRFGPLRRLRTCGRVRSTENYAIHHSSGRLWTARHVTVRIRTDLVMSARARRSVAVKVAVAGSAGDCRRAARHWLGTETAPLAGPLLRICWSVSAVWERVAAEQVSAVVYRISRHPTVPASPSGRRAAPARPLCRRHGRVQVAIAGVPRSCDKGWPAVEPASHRPDTAARLANAGRSRDRSLQAAKRWSGTPDKRSTGR